MNKLLQTQKCDKSKTCPLISNQSKLLNRDRKPLVLRPPLIQAKLAISQPGDKYEQEADRVAEQVMRMPEGDVLQHKCARCGEDEKKVLQPKESVGQVPVTRSRDVPTIVHKVLRSPGQPLDASTRAFMEPRFGHDFSRLRVHTDARAAESAREVNALAYTVGKDVVFDKGQYFPETRKSQRLLAHELSHVVQQEKIGPSLIQRSNEESSLPYDSKYSPSRDHCEIYQSPLARRWLTYSYRHNAECACSNTPDEPHNNCVRKCLQVKMRRHLALESQRGRALPWTFPLEADPMCRDMWTMHVECYRECGCNNNFTNYPVFSTMCRMPFPCFVVSGSISWFNACL